MISYWLNKEPARVIRNAVLDDIAPLPRGTVFEYWRGETDLEPTGKRGEAFRQALSLHEMGRLELVQVKIGDGEYSYRGAVK